MVQKLTKNQRPYQQSRIGCFNNRLMRDKRWWWNHPGVDTYRADSLKSATRDKRRQGRASIQYQVRDDTNIKHIPLNRFPSHDKKRVIWLNILQKKYRRAVFQYPYYRTHYTTKGRVPITILPYSLYYVGPRSNTQTTVLTILRRAVFQYYRTHYTT